MNRSVSQRSTGRKFLSLIYKSNPFYLISCAIVLFGVQLSLTRHPDFGASPIPVAIVFVVFTTAAAIAGVMIVRLGRVWDDARTIFLILLLMFFALASSFDQWCLDRPEVAAVILTLGFLFSVIVTEFVLRSLSIKFPGFYRSAYCVILGTTFLYPISFSTRNAVAPDLHMGWLILGYPVAISVGSLILLSAIRQGRRALAKNGTPWLWPFYPWSVFVIILLGVVGRTFMIGSSFDTASDLSLQPYFFSPLVLAFCLILHEIGFVESNKTAKALSLLLAPSVLLLAGISSNLLNGVEFVEHVCESVGSPIWLTSVALIFFYAYCFSKQTTGSELALVLSLLLATFCSEDTLSWTDVVLQTSWPFFVLATLSFFTATESGSRRVIGSVLYLAAGCAVAGGQYVGVAGAIAGAHIVLPGFLLIMVWYSDLASHNLRIFNYIFFPIATVLVAIIGFLGSIPMEFALAEIACLGVLYCAACWKILHDRIFKYTCYFCATLGSLVLFMYGIQKFSRIEDRGLASMAFAGCVCFAIALAISGAKGGASVILADEWKKCLLEIRRERRAIRNRNSLPQK